MLTLDTNILVYTADCRQLRKQETARKIVTAAARTGGVVGLQAISEMQNALSKRLRFSVEDTLAAVRDALTFFPTFSYDDQAVRKALTYFESGRLQYWDALLISAASAVGCTTMISEDMADGAVFEGVTIVHPFNEHRDPSDRVCALLHL